MKLYLLFLLAAFAQVTLLPYLAVYGIFPNLVLLLVFYAGFYRSRVLDALLPSALAGIALDAFSGLPFGILALSIVSILFGYHFLLSFLPRTTLWHLLFFVCAGTAAFHGFVFVFMRVFFFFRFPGSFAFTAPFVPIMIEMVYNSAVISLFYLSRRMLRQ